MTTRTIRLDEMSLDDLIELGVEHVNDRLPKPLLILAARKYVQAEHRQRERARERAAERKAYGMTESLTPDRIASMVLDASLTAAREATMNWRPLLDVPFLVPTRDIQTTWGRATVDEHRDRAEWLEHLATGNVRTASHHRKAIDDIDQYRVHNLIEAVAKGAD